MGQKKVDMQKITRLKVGKGIWRYGDRNTSGKCYRNDA